MKLQAMALVLIVSSNLFAQQIITEDDNTSVLRKIMKCEQKLSAISTYLDDASTLELSNVRSQGIQIFDNKIDSSEGFGKAIGNGNYYLRPYKSGRVQSLNNKAGVIDVEKLKKMLDTYISTKKLSADIFLSDADAKNVKLKAVHAFQLVRNNLLGALYSDDALDEAILVEVDVDSLTYKKELEQDLKNLIKETSKDGSNSLHSHMGDLIGVLLDELLSKAPESSVVPALEKLDTLLPNCK